ncbi:MAG TPA: alpha/beta hydrolase-fold protein [Thermoanaerobaculia bacterium]|nr:alpha/beta hydrolase-fold protein [Thermoanaerobaculia bacterium]
MSRGLAIDRLLARQPDAAAVERFLARHRFPLVEGSTATFVFRGEADEVLLRHWIWGLPSARPFQRVADTELWYLVEELPAGSRVEYKLEVVRDGGRELLQDPLNPQLARDPFGANSVCQAAGYETPAWTLPDPEARPGEIVEMAVESRALGGRRRVGVYLPARLRPTRRYPLIVAHDGFDYLRYAALGTVLDNLIHRLEIPQVVVALTDSPGRLEEYAAQPGHARFVTEELVPKLERELPLRGGPSGRCLMGASFGAVASLATAWRYPGFYGRLLLQSGSFAFTDIGVTHRGPAFEPVVEFVNAFRRAPGRCVERLFVSCGVYESLIYENRSLVPLLQRTGMEVRYVEARDGHNWENWRDRLREGLSWLFPGPLWMVYE